MCRDTGQLGVAIRPRCTTIRRWGLRYARHSAQGRARRYGRGGLRHGRCSATIRRSARCLGAVRADCACILGSGCAPGVPNLVLDSVHCFSHCLDHC